MPLSAIHAFYSTADALRAYTDDLRILAGQNPIDLILNETKFSIHISLIHDSGNNRGNDDERRIQVSRDAIHSQIRKKRAGYQIIFIGYYSDGSMFTAWEPEYVLSQRNNDRGSVYTRESHREIVSRTGLAIRRFRSRNLGRFTSALTLPTGFLGFYLENWRNLHAASSDLELREALNFALGTSAPFGSAPASASKILQLGGSRKRVTVTRTSFVRSPAFTRTILKAYGNCCCICGRQMGLVQAAHIIPHGHPESRDHTSNGLALCVEHHKLYDDGLVLPVSNQAIFINEERAEYLKRINQDSGLREVIELSKTSYRLPAEKIYHPDNNLLERGARIRRGLDT